MMYRWLVFLHVASSFLFMMTHGATAAVMFRLRAEVSQDSLFSLIKIRRWAEIPFSIATAVMFLSGIALAIIGGWWRTGWIWSSLAIFVLITVAMATLGRRYLDGVAAHVAGFASGDARDSIADPANAFDISEAASAGRPVLLGSIGIIGILVILWLMMFKPF
ncbi:MAG: DUF2269 family protein [Anaerolineales bacterium]